MIKSNKERTGLITVTIADYTLEYINGIPYLMPYGQPVADLKKCVKLNDTWFLYGTAFQMALEEMKFYLKCAKNTMPLLPCKTILSDDFDSFLDILTAYRVFES